MPTYLPERWKGLSKGNKWENKKNYYSFTSLTFINYFYIVKCWACYSGWRVLGGTFQDYFCWLLLAVDPNIWIKKRCCTYPYFWGHSYPYFRNWMMIYLCPYLGNVSGCFHAYWYLLFLVKHGYSYYICI